MELKFESRYAVSPNEARNMDTRELRENFLIEKIFEEGKMNLVLSHFDRYIAGGIMPGKESVTLPNPAALKAEFFLQRREMGIINVGAKGKVLADGVEYVVENKEALYLGMGTRDITFTSLEEFPAKFYINSAPAHHSFPSRLVTKKDADIVELGSMETANKRTIYKLIVSSVLQVCQLQMGMTELHPGSVWNTMPPHTHDRRMEVYFYFDLPEQQSVCHFMGQPEETRHIWMQNEQAVISPNWSIHAGAGTNNYTFIWGMAGENLDYDDMDKTPVSGLK